MKALNKFGVVLLSAALAAGIAAASEPSPGITNIINADKPYPSAPGRVEINCSNGVRPIAANLILKNSKGAPVEIPGLYGGAFPAKGCAFGLPPGFYEIRVSAGPRYVSWHTTFKINSDEKLIITAVLQPFYPLWERGWIAFDPYVAAGQEHNPRPSLAAILLQALSRGVRGLGIDNSARLFRGEGKGKSAPGAGQATPRNPQPVLSAGRDARGGYCLRPWPGFAMAGKGFSLREKATPFLYQRLAEWKADNAFTVWQQGKGGAELVFATVAGPLYDAIDVSDHDYSLKLWSFLLNQGYRVLAVTGGPSLADTAAKAGNNNHADSFAAVGGYFPATGAVDSKTFLGQLRGGNVIASNGPFVSFQIDSVSPGTILTTSRALRRITITAFASAAAADSMGSLDLLYNGKVLRQYPGAKHQRSQEITAEAAFPQPGWAAVFYRSTTNKYFAIANPVWFADLDSRPPRPVTTTVKFRIIDDDNPPPCRVEIWNTGAFLGRYQVGKKGLNLDLPPTARLVVMDGRGKLIAEHTIFQASGAAAYTERLAADPGALRQALLDKKTYARMREMLAEVLLPIKLNPDAGEE